MKSNEETKEHEFTLDVSLPYHPAPRSFEDSMRSIAKITKKSHREVLQKSKYDIDFVIRVLKDQLIVIEKERYRPSSLALTMSHSIKSLLSFLEVEKRNQENKTEREVETYAEFDKIESCIEFLESYGYKVIKN